MKITFYGTRGSVPVSGPDYNQFGGNTTCLRIESVCLPNAYWLIVDAGSGLVPLGKKAVNAGVKVATILFTHYHHDHTQGLFLSPLIFDPSVRLNLYGPKEEGVGPAEMTEALMRPPFHPVAFAKLGNHVFPKSITDPSSQVMVIHPEGGLKIMRVDELAAAEETTKQLIFGRSRFRIAECLVVRMLYTHHPERTICYRFEERPTGKSFVFLTDHENLDGLPLKLRTHLGNVDLLIMDCQYTREEYAARTAGFGHATPDYCVALADAVGAKRLGFTHHDPLSNDDKVGQILDELRFNSGDMPIAAGLFACSDYQSVDI